MCVVKLMGRKNTRELITVLGLTVSMEMAAKANTLEMIWELLRAKEDDPMRMALNFEVRGKRKKGYSNNTWKGKVKDNLAFNYTKWRKCVTTFENEISLPTSVNWDTTALKLE